MRVNRSAAAPPLNTTIGVVATSAVLTRPEAGRLAQSAHDGLARAIRPAHALVDGDTITLYYGASDTVICRATLSIADILTSLTFR